VYNGNQCSQRTSFLPCAQFQAALYAATKADSNLKNLPVFAETEPGAEPDDAGLQFLTIPAGARTLMADGTVLADYANLHNYVKCSGCRGLRGANISRLRPIRLARSFGALPPRPGGILRAYRKTSRARC